MQYVLTDYFKTHDSITRSQVEKLCKMKRTTACARLNELVKSGFLRKVDYNKETKYEIVRYNVLLELEKNNPIYKTIIKK